MTATHPEFLHLQNPLQLPTKLQGLVLAIGNFDGLHRGHRSVVDRAIRMGERLRRPVALLSFDPHPRLFFQPGLQLFHLSTGGAKARLAERAGLDALITLDFNAELASKTADEFIQQILVDRLAISGAVVGFDFQFGAKRSGNADLLVQAGKRLGFAVEVVPEFKDATEEISSTIIRSKLAAGDVATANRLLGYEWFVIGEVLHGRKVGRTIGYPTANLRLAEDCGLKHGIYAVRFTVDGKTHSGVASFGRRPTFDNGAPLLEVFVFDFNGDLYGKIVEVAFVGFIRVEAKFETVDTLVAQMDRDSAEARRLLAC